MSDFSVIARNEAIQVNIRTSIFEILMAGNPQTLNNKKIKDANGLPRFARNDAA
jgi:hypothetical protein